MSDRKPAPQLGRATEAFVHERASATPTTATTRETKLDPCAHAPPAPRDSSLRAIEEWFVAAITAPHASDALDADAARLLTPGPRLTAADRLGIYRYGYRARLIECLADDYPAVQFALGHDAFEAVCLGYIERHPSSAPSLNFYGRHMAHFLRESAHFAPGDELRGFAADLASLEWALVEVLHARVADRLSQETLAAIPIEKWVEARLPSGDAVRVLRFDYPVNAYFQAFKTDRAPSTAQFGRNQSATAVYRTDMTLWRMDLTPAMTTLLESLFAGRPLGAALETLEDGLTAEDAAEAERNVMAWFREWVAAGFFKGVELGEGTSSATRA